LERVYLGNFEKSDVGHKHRSRSPCLINNIAGVEWHNITENILIPEIDPRKKKSSS